jgi:DNA-binding NarL/FixJ family response regulator
VTDVRVLIVDDQEDFRGAVHDLLRQTPGFEPVGDVSSGADAVAAVEEVRPELVLLDVRMPGMDGIETARRIAARDPGVVIVLVSADEPEDLPEGASSCGASAYVRKRELGRRRLLSLWSAVTA